MFIHAAVCIAGILLLCPGVVLANLPDWVRFIQGDSPERDALFKTVHLPQGGIMVRRSPREARAAFSDLIGRHATAPVFYALRAREAERQLDFAAAEADWKTFADLQPSIAQAWLALADFYHRRLRPNDEVEVLLKIAGLAGPENECCMDVRQQSAWKAFERSIEVIESHALPADLAIRQYRAWIERYPRQQSVYLRFFDFLVKKRRFSEAEALLPIHASAFRGDPTFAVKAEAELIRKRESLERALAYYDRVFDPSWPPALVADYFNYVEEAQEPLRFSQQLPATLEQDPGDHKAAAKVFYYLLREGNLGAAERLLSELRERKQKSNDCWSASELLTHAHLFVNLNHRREAGFYYDAAYHHPDSTEQQMERSLVGLIEALAAILKETGPSSSDERLDAVVTQMLNAPEWRSKVGSLLYCPGTAPRSEEGRAVAPQDETSSVDVNELLAELDAGSAPWDHRDRLQFALLEACEAVGDDECLLGRGAKFLTDFTESDLRAAATLLMAKVHSRNNQLSREFALYDSLLRELSAKADGVPLGSGSTARQPGSRGRLGRSRSPHYAHVLAHSASRLVELHRSDDAIRMYKREIERNPRDPGLYEHFARFLQQNKLEAELEILSHQAIQRLSDASWYRRLARWYLRQRNDAALERLTVEAATKLPGAEVEVYFAKVIHPSVLESTVYLKVNLLAHKRFPYNLTFVRNLLRAYTTPNTRDDAAAERLLREYWFYDDGLRESFLDRLSDAGRIESEVEALRSANDAARAGRWQQLVRENPAAAQFLAEAEIRHSRLESAVPLMLALAHDFPVDRPLIDRATALLRTIALANPLYIHVLVGLEEGLHYFDPRDRQQLARLGELWADQGEFERAQSYWEQIADVERGKPEGYLEAAAAFERYGRIAGALRVLQRGRDRLQQERGLFECETGALHEQKKDISQALADYLAGAIRREPKLACRQRLTVLSPEPPYRDRIDLQTRALSAGRNPRESIIRLRVGVLKAQRPGRVAGFLRQKLEDTVSVGVATVVGRLAAEEGLASVRIGAIKRQIGLTDDPIERLRLQLWLLLVLEGLGDLEAAKGLLDEIGLNHAKTVGDVLDVVDAHWKNRDFRLALEAVAEAARSAYRQLGKKSTLLAVQRATELGGFDRARLLLLTLLAEEPFRTDYVAAMGETYLREGRHESLRNLYERTMDELTQALLPASEKRQRLVALRLELISALTRIGDSAGVVDQYVELIGDDPADEESVAEAARYASLHRRDSHLVGYFSTSGDEEHSALVLSILNRLFEDLPLAVAEAPTRREAVTEQITGVTPRTPPRGPTGEDHSIGGKAGERSGPSEGASAVRNDLERRFWVQVGAFKVRINATRLASQLQEKGYHASKFTAEGYDRVLVGAFDGWSEVVQMERQLLTDGYETWVRYTPGVDHAK